jgi:hypothetical protein
MDNSKQWFLAELIFRLRDHTSPSVQQFDKHYRPIIATGAREAYQMALIAASRELDKRKDYTKEYLQWEFIGLEALKPIQYTDSLTGHHEIIKAPKNIPAYIQSLRTINATIQMKIAETA